MVIAPDHTPHIATRDSRSAEGPDPGRPSRRIPGKSERLRQIDAAQTQLLYDNIRTGVLVTVGVASLLAYAHWNLRPRIVVAAWLAYMLLVSGARLAMAMRYRSARASDSEVARWNRAFVVGCALAGTGWGVGAFMLLPSAQPMSEILVVFAVGGIMLGGAATLAARPEAFLAFLLPAGVLTSIRLASLGDESHLIMGFLGAAFTAATIVTTWRYHRELASSFDLRFENHDLIESLQRAKDDAEALNRELEVRVRDRTAKLLDADQRKDEFLATLAHELRNPLAPIPFALRALKGESPGFTAARAHDVIERQVTQLVRLVDDLLDVSRITANKIQLRRESLDLAHVMSAAVEAIAPLATAAGHHVDVRLAPAPILINGDSARLVQVLTNVLNNAVKFTPRGGHIGVSADVESHEAVVRVRDTGIGVAPDVLPRVFDMFHQAEPALERSTGGLGIGLTLARRLVEMHDGTIAIRSAGIGRGTEVEIRLPTSAAAVTTATSVVERAAAPVRVLRVLIVEDNVDAAEMLELAVAHLGHVTALAHDGAAAITTAAEFAPDLVLLDIGLPVMNGYVVAQTLRESPKFRHAHIAAVTGWGQDEDRRKAREAGCDSHFTKPLSPATLENLLTNVARDGRETEGRQATSTPRTRLTDSGTVC